MCRQATYTVNSGVRNQNTVKRFGTYVVLWFKDEGRYPYPTGWSMKEEFEQELHTRCENLTNECGIRVACYVVDMTAAIRRH
jgi:hypothetical protein